MMPKVKNVLTDSDCLEAILEIQNNRPLATWEEKFDKCVRIIKNHRQRKPSIAWYHKDVHSEKALELFGVVTPETRQKAKIINYQTGYRKEVS